MEDVSVMGTLPLAQGITQLECANVTVNTTPPALSVRDVQIHIKLFPGKELMEMDISNVKVCCITSGGHKNNIHCIGLFRGLGSIRKP